MIAPSPWFFLVLGGAFFWVFVVKLVLWMVS